MLIEVFSHEQSIVIRYTGKEKGTHLREQGNGNGAAKLGEGTGQ